ncbi:DNA mismatch repair protein MutS [Flavobacteriaceae bacterium]|nr:DNA mismatch repair protein MutS [Flavobacteriaceae bacterium]
MAKSSKNKVSPLMQQYNSIKTKYPDALLLFRVGDFYETFGEDAIKAAKVLGIILTKRGAGSVSETELAGFPHHSLNTYLPKLVKAGMRVAICDQLEDPKKTKKLVKRGVTELITPGVSLNDEVLQAKVNNFLAALHFGKKGIIGVAFADISTGEFYLTQGNRDSIDKLLQNFQPSELLIQKQKKALFQEEFTSDYHEFYLEDWVFNIDFAEEILLNHFESSSFKGFGIDKMNEGLQAAGAIMHYLSETQHKDLAHISKISRIHESDFIWMDRFTIRNLELFQASNLGGVALIDVIDRTLSPMGGRMLKHWLALPLVDQTLIEARNKKVGQFLNQTESRATVRYHLEQLYDLERMVSKIATAKISPRELVQLKNSLKAIEPIKTALKDSNIALTQDFPNLKILADYIEKHIQEQAPVLISKGNVIAQGVNSELDELRGLANSGKEFLDQMLARESEATGIPSLKIAFNNVFGYYIEVRNTHKDKVPDHWVRKQTLVSAERYISEELKTYEEKILGAEEKISSLESQIYNQVIQELHRHINSLQKSANLIAQIDVLSSFAELAESNNYIKPALNKGNTLFIKNGRHPVIERQMKPGEAYIANDVNLDPSSQQIIMITGPNMSGKSAILRQTALIVLLAQIGCFVPAESAEIGVVDKIFTRVGASDNISAGESTFMVEMNETASILNNLSKNSLILLDEIGRGTSTYDGISIAWAIAEYLHEHPTGAKTLFATHYHELNEMSKEFNRIKNFNVSVKELADKVIFLRKLIPGGSEHSFGIHVAKLAGMPSPVLHRAKKMLKTLEKNHSGNNVETSANDDLQLSFFQLDDPLLEDLRDEILGTDLDSLTPIEALMKLNEIKRMIQKK